MVAQKMTVLRALKSIKNLPSFLSNMSDLLVALSDWLEVQYGPKWYLDFREWMNDKPQYKNVVKFYDEME